MDNILFIVNPIAGGGKANALMPMIESTMNLNHKNFDIEISEKPEQAIKIAEKNADKYDIIVAVGGDGTVNEVSKGIMNRGMGVLGIIPGGTGNDMAKSLDIPMNPEEALEIILKGNKKQIDIGIANSFHFLNIASVGFDAEVVINNIRIKKKIKNHISYIISVIYTLFSFKNKRIRIEIDGKVFDEEVLLMAVGNGKYYGGGMKILPLAEVDDGNLYICIISNISKLRILALFPTIFKGTHIKHTKYVKNYTGKKVKILGEKELPLNIDGDTTTAREVNFSIEEKRLTVIVKE